jgi:hypothetical protein
MEDDLQATILRGVLSRVGGVDETKRAMWNRDVVTAVHTDVVSAVTTGQ